MTLVGKKCKGFGEPVEVIAAPAVSVTPKTTYEFYCAGLIRYYQLSSCANIFAWKNGKLV